jgi:crossover junction endodeoxyribonuclease RusA
MTIILHLPWPARPLWQNSPRGGHWSTKAKAIKAARNDAALIGLEGGLRAYKGKAVRMVWQFHPPSRRKVDVPNLIGALKAHIDGLADAIGIDDSTFRMAFPEVLSEPVKGGLIVVEIAPFVAIAEKDMAA